LCVSDLLSFQLFLETFSFGFFSFYTILADLMPSDPLVIGFVLPALLLIFGCAWRSALCWRTRWRAYKLFGL